VAFGVPSLAVVLITILLLDIFERSWISFFVPATVSVVMYSLPSIRLDGPIRRAEMLILIATSLVVSLILCAMAWGGTSVSIQKVENHENPKNSPPSLCSCLSNGVGANFPVSLLIGAVLEEGKGEKTLLTIGGLLPDFIVLMTILGGLAVSC